MERDLLLVESSYLAGVDMDVSVYVSAVTVDDALTDYRN